MDGTGQLNSHIKVAVANGYYTIIARPELSCMCTSNTLFCNNSPVRLCQTLQAAVTWLSLAPHVTSHNIYGAVRESGDHTIYLAAPIFSLPYVSVSYIRAVTCGARVTHVIAAGSWMSAHVTR